MFFQELCTKCFVVVSKTSLQEQQRKHQLLFLSPILQIIKSRPRAVKCLVRDLESASDEVGLGDSVRSLRTGAPRPPSTVTSKKSPDLPESPKAQPPRSLPEGCSETQAQLCLPQPLTSVQLTCQLFPNAASVDRSSSSGSRRSSWANPLKLPQSPHMWPQ